MARVLLCCSRHFASLLFVTQLHRHRLRSRMPVYRCLRPGMEQQGRRIKHEKDERVRWRDTTCALQTLGAMRERDVCAPHKEMVSEKCAGDTECVHAVMRMMQKEMVWLNKFSLSQVKVYRKLIESFSTAKCRNKVVHSQTPRCHHFFSVPRHFSNIWSSSENSAHVLPGKDQVRLRVTHVEGTENHRKKGKRQNRSAIFAMKNPEADVS